jgi:hypothetical protein
VHDQEEMVDEIVREVGEAFDLPPAKAKAIVEMVAARLQSSSGSDRREHDDRKDDDHGHEHREHDRYQQSGHGPGQPKKKGGLRGLLGDVGGFLGGE